MYKSVYRLRKVKKEGPNHDCPFAALKIEIIRPVIFHIFRFVVFFINFDRLKWFYSDGNILQLAKIVYDIPVFSFGIK